MKAAGHVVGTCAEVQASVGIQAGSCAAWEPRRANRVARKSWNCPKRNPGVLLERETGIEPATNGLGSRYSTIELLPPACSVYQTVVNSAASSTSSSEPGRFQRWHFAESTISFTMVNTAGAAPRTASLSRSSILNDAPPTVMR